MQSTSRPTAVQLKRIKLEALFRRCGLLGPGSSPELPPEDVGIDSSPGQPNQVEHVFHTLGLVGAMIDSGSAPAVVGFRPSPGQANQSGHVFSHFGVFGGPGSTP